VQANPKLWGETAIMITFDEGGGYWDSGYVQPLDFFGDGTRIPMIVVSPFSAGGQISHGYSDHVSTLKFIEANWKIGPVSPNGRDALPNPVSADGNPYVPINAPAISDLMDMFDFKSKSQQLARPASMARRSGFGRPYYESDPDLTFIRRRASRRHETRRCQTPNAPRVLLSD
jgi:phospholipase C